MPELVQRALVTLYGESAPEDGERADPTRPGWLSRLLEWQRQAPDTDTFWTELRDELSRDREITVFSEADDEPPLHLPGGATCLDAAYARHGQAAHACIGARVNGRLATLRTVLRDGDTVRLLLAPDARAARRSTAELVHGLLTRLPVPAPARS